MAGIFKAYDIRGEYPNEINEDLFEEIGKSLKILDNPKKIIVGHDMRESSVFLKEALIEGINQSGIEVIDIGLSSTPMVYQASHDIDCDLAVVITASHEGANFNGLKICKRDAIPISYDNGIDKIEEYVNSGIITNEHEKGSIELREDYSNKYLDFMKTFTEGKKNIKVVLDSGNGMGAFVDNSLIGEICNLEELYCTLDGTFPNHEANPVKEENLNDLKKRVLETNADLGIAFDGDADRIGIIDEKGNFVPADLIGAFLIDNYIEKYPNEKVYSYDLRSTMEIQELLDVNGKEGIKTRVGHSYIKAIMRNKNSFFSFELSGHLYFWHGENVVYDSSLRATIELINILGEKNKPLSELLKKYQKYSKSKEINFEVREKDLILKKVIQKYSDAKIEMLDGVTIQYDTWWANIRASNTEDILRLNLEAKDEEIFNKKVEEIKILINNTK